MTSFVILPSTLLILSLDLNDFAINNYLITILDIQNLVDSQNILIALRQFESKFFHYNNVQLKCRLYQQPLKMAVGDYRCSGFN